VSDDLGQLRLTHLRYGAPGVGLNAEDIRGLPEGWRIVTRRWGFRRWDALIRPPAPKVGWGLGAANMTRTRRGAIKRARAEILEYLDKTESRERA